MARIKHIPSVPGVYFFRDQRGKILYIGKAKNLKNRLRDHPMLEISDRVQWQEVGSEIEALILESEWIKKYHPPHNIMLPEYVYVQFTNEEFPKVFIARREGVVGPFTNASELRAALKVLRKLFPYCTCRQKHSRLCLNAQIGKCLGICCLKNSKSEIRNTKQITKAYQTNIKILKQILSGKKQAFMKQFPNVFANARIIKEIAGRESATEKLGKILGIKNIRRIEGYDISNIHGKYATGSMVVFENGYPNTSEYRKFKIQAPSAPNDILMLREMLTRRFSHTEWPRPDLILIDGGKAQLNVAKKLFSPVLSIAKGKQEIFSTTLDAPMQISNLQSSIKNLILHLDAEAHRFAITYYRKLHRKSARNL